MSKKFDNTYTGTLWMATHPTDVTKTLDDRMSGNFVGGQNEPLRINAKKQGTAWTWELLQMPVKPKRKVTIIATGTFSPTGLTRAADADFDPPCISGSLTGSLKGQGTVRMVGFLKDHEFKGQYIQLVRARNQAAPAKISL